MLYLLSAINLLKNVAVKLWSIKWIRFLAIGGFAYYLISGFGSQVMSRASNTTFTFPGWDAIITIPEINYNPNFVKSNKASYGIMNAISRLGSIFIPGSFLIAIVLFVQKALNTFKAPPLPIVYTKDDADEVLVADYRMPVLYTKGEPDYYEEDEEDEIDEQTGSANNLDGLKLQEGGAN